MERVRHKESNRFRFIPFSERIFNVNVDIFHRVPHRFEEESSEKYTYFFLTLQKWTVLNLTKKWKSFRREVGSGFETLPQLLNKKEAIVEVFMKNIKLQDELSLAPVLELIVALVKDLRYEFYPFYPQFLKELIQLLKFKDPDILEATFTCLAYLFKYLSRKLVKDLDKVLLDLAPLLNDSNPEYVRDFAAQSFSFVARKVKDKNKFLSLVLFAVQSSQQVSAGCGQLVFEMMKGIKGQSHSCAEELLPVLFHSFGKNDVPQKTLFLLTSQVVEAYGNNIKPLYSILFKVLVDVLRTKLETEEVKGVRKLLKIVRIGVNCKGGAHLNETDLPHLLNLLVKILSLSADLQKLAVPICSDMLKLKSLKLPQEFATKLIFKIIQIPEIPVLLQFLEETSDYVGFEACILPRVFQHLPSLDSKDFLKVLTKIVSEKTSKTAKNTEGLDANPLELNVSTARFSDFVRKVLKNFFRQDSEVLLCCIILVRHLEPIDRQEVMLLLCQIANNCLNRIKISVEGKQEKWFTLCLTLETLLYFKKEFSYCEGFEGSAFCEVILRSLKNDKSILHLRSLDLFLTLADDFIPSEELFEELYSTIQEWLLSPQSNSRLLALHSIQKLEETRLSKAAGDMVNVLQSAVDAELIPLTITDYRDKINLLEKLHFERLVDLEDLQHKVLVKYLLGSLYCNFKLLWDPISQIIASYSVGMSINTFWEVLYSQLRTATAMCKGMTPSEDFNLPQFDDFILNGVKFIKAKDKVAHHNYRNLLWNTLNLFPDLCEAKNRDVISIFLPFIENELLKFSGEHNLTINIRENVSVVKESNENLEECVAEDSKSKNAFSEVLKCAVAQLKLLSKFKNPKYCFREPDVQNCYLELLLHKDVEIQKMALECILTYKFSYMTPYKKNLRNLLDDGKFRDELINFQIDTETGIIKDIHRKELMPIVMRILYSKMLFRSSTPRGNKGSASLLRRSIILRFLAGSTDAEKEMFLKMAFSFYDSYCRDDIFQFRKIVDSVDLAKVPPPKKLQSAVNLAEVILNNFGGLMSVELQLYVFRVLLCVGCFVCGIFSKRGEIHVGYLPSLKNVRTTCLDAITKFFDLFQKFPWREDDINALFHVFVWPSLSKLAVEGIHNPTALLRLFAAWSKDPRYFKLLARYDPKEPSLTPIPYLMELLLNEKAQEGVAAHICSILENLLTLHEEEPMEIDNEEEPPPPLNVEHILPVEEADIEKLHLKVELNYGSKILFPHVGSILTFLRRKLEESSGFGKSHLTVLSRITEMATSCEHGDALMKLLIKLLSSSKKTDDDSLVSMVTTVENLTKILPDPGSYLRALAALFGTVELIQARKILVNMVVGMERRCPELRETMVIIRELNAWDGRWVEQPDFDRRLDAFKSVRNLTDREDFNVDLVFIVLHNCFYFVRCETDLSLRDCASHCLKDMCPKVANILNRKPSIRHQWIENILSLTKRGIASDNENYQTLSISLLGVMARECQDLHPVLNDLSVLANKQDPEVDFFENAQHLQIYRRLKALLRFSSTAKTLQKPPSTRTLTHFILPLASRYLCCKKYSGKNSLVDSAIEVVGTVCRFLPWHQYQTVLRFYLAKLRTKIEFQKQLTRTVIAILDSFHFDISRSPSVSQEIKNYSSGTQKTDDTEMKEGNKKYQEDVEMKEGNKKYEEDVEMKEGNKKYEEDVEMKEGNKKYEEDVEMKEGNKKYEEDVEMKEGNKKYEEDLNYDAEAKQHEEGGEEKVIEKTEETIIEKTEENIIEETVENMTEETEENITEKTEENVIEKTEETIIEETVENMTEETEENVIEKTEENVIEKTEETIIEETVENMTEKTEENVIEKTEETIIEETVENMIEETEEKQLADAEELTKVLEGAEAQEKVDPEEERKMEKENEKTLAIESITILSPSAALQVEKAISGPLLEQLYKIIGQKSQAESTHKVNYKNLGPEKDEEDCLKVPIAVTLVKLLQKLPKRMLETQIPGIFMRLCTFLKSRTESVRRVTRDTLQQILYSLGPKYLSLLFAEMSAALKKGFQVHVLVYTMHSVIQHIQGLLQPGDIDSNFSLLMEACKSDLFGSLGEEKRLAQIRAQHKEAKRTKSYHLVHLMAQYLTERCLTDLIAPVIEVLQISYSHKNITKCREYLRQVTLGLSANQFISSENLYIYVYGTTSESIPQLLPTPPEPPKKKNPKEVQDCFIIPPEPKTRTGVSSNPVKKGSRSNAHIIVEFGFYLLHNLLKRDKVKNVDGDVRGYLDPIAPILINSLGSQHVKVATLALQCLSKAIKYDLPNIKSDVKKMTDCLFSILHKYAAAGLCKGDNFDLVTAAFKAISTLIRETEYHGITVEQIKILLLYVEQDIHSNNRQATAFTLLKTILRKKLNSPELHELMMKVAALSVSSELPHIRLQARQTVFQYMVDYPLKKKMEDFIGFYISQLKYSVESGRQSSLEMIQSLISSFPKGLLEEHSAVFFITLGAQLLNEESATCKKAVGGVIKAMLTRLEPSQRDKLFDILLIWLQQRKRTHRMLAAQMAGLFVAVEKEKFSNRLLPSFLLVIQKQFIGGPEPGQFVRLPKSEAEVRLKDHHFFQVLQLLLKICSYCPDFLTSEEYQENIFFLLEIAQGLLCHPHEWVRLGAAQFLGHVFNSCQPGDVATVLSGGTVDSKLSFLEPTSIHRRIRSLILDHCAQLIPGVEIGQKFIDQTIKNLVYFARVLKSVKEKGTEKEESFEEGKEEDEESSAQTVPSFLWLIRRMRRVVNMELGQTPTSNVLRSAVLKWIGAVAMCSSKSELSGVLYHLMAPVVREREIIETESKENPLKPLVMEIFGILKKKVGVDAFSKEAVKIRGKLLERRVQRRSHRAQEFITNPEGAAKRKIEKQIKKKEARKRKMEKLKGKKENKFKRRRTMEGDR